MRSEMAKKAKSWICQNFNCRRKNELKRRKCVYCKTPKRKSKTALIKELDRVFSIYIRKRDKGRCFTCGGKATDAGHYKRRGIMSLRWDKRNVNAQCRRCNHFESGKLDVYAVQLTRKYGWWILEELEEKAKKTFSPTREWLEAKIKEYKANAL